jgi:hypothetical protein
MGTRFEVRTATAGRPSRDCPSHPPPPAGDRSAQAITAAGQGAHVTRCLIEDLRRERGLSGAVAPHYDWRRPESEFAGEWADRDRRREWFETEIEVEDRSGDRLAALREEVVDAAFETRVDDEAIERRRERGLERPVAALGPEEVLRAIDDEAVLLPTREIDRSGSTTGERA